jgi:site-specific DNA-cytosine methylase
VKTILAIDFDKWAAETYLANFPSVEVRCASVANEVSNLPYADVIIGGPPCQPYSQAGERKGENDDRDCVPDFIEAVERGKPRMFLMENVDGLLSIADGRVAQKIFTMFEDAGYVVEVKTLDSVQFGVPQFRSRCWWWGIRKDLYAAGVRHQWPAPTHCWPPQSDGLFGGALEPGVTVGQALHIWYPGCGWQEDGADSYAVRTPRSKGVIRRDHPVGEPSPTLDARGALGGGSCKQLVRVIGGGSNPRSPGDERTERDITREPSTTIPCDAGNAIPYRWSAAMLAKHPPASPASPASPILAKFYKGGAEGLLQIFDAQNEKFHGVDERIGTIQGEAQAKGGKAGHYITDNKKHQPHQPANTLNSGGGGHGPTFANQHVELSADGRTWDSRHAPALPDLPGPTVRARSRRDGGRCTENVVREGIMVRRLTPDECMRLMSAPDNFKWPDKISKTAKYKIAGNGWACRMGAVFAQAFRRADSHSETVIDLFCGGGLGACGWHRRFWNYQANSPLPSNRKESV